MKKTGKDGVFAQGESFLNLW